MASATTQPRRRRSPVGIIIGAAIVVVLAVLVLSSLFGRGLFVEKKTVDAGTVVGVLSEESTLKAASRDYRTRVSFDEDERGDWLPDWLYGRHLTFDVDGRVTAEVDLGAIDDDSITIDGDDVTVTLRTPSLGTPTIDEIQPISDDRGLLNRLNDFFDTNQEMPSELVTTAQKQLIESAAADQELKRLAEQHTEEIVSGLLEPVTDGEVTVRFEDGARPET